MHKVRSLSDERADPPLAERREEEGAAIDVGKKKLDGILINFYMLRPRDLCIPSLTLSLGLHGALTRKAGAEKRK